MDSSRYRLLCIFGSRKKMIKRHKLTAFLTFILFLIIIYMNKTSNSYSNIIILKNDLLCKRSNLSYADVIALRHINLTSFRGLIANECDLFNKTEFLWIKDHELFEQNKLNYKLVRLLIQQGLLQEKFEEDPELIQKHYYSLQLNIQELIVRTGLKEDEFQCTVTRYDKTLNRDEQRLELAFETAQIFERKFNFTLYYAKHGFYWTRCFTKIKNSLIYESPYYVYPHNMNQLRVERERIVSEHSKENDVNWQESIKFLNKPNSFKIKEKMNVLILAFDSVSYHNFKRIFPVTYNYLDNVLKDNIIYTTANVVGNMKCK